MPTTRRRRTTRLLIAFPAVLASWAVLVGLPMAPNPPGKGRLVAQTVTLTGPGAAPTVAAGSPPGAGTRAVARSAVRGWSARVPVNAGTQMATLSWKGTPRGAVELRARARGVWSDWTAQAADPEDGPDQGGNGRTGVGLVWFGHDGADQVEMRVTNGTLDDLVLDAMRWEPPAGGGMASAGASVAQPTIHPRSEWEPGGWRFDNPGCSSGPTVMPSLKFAVVHHTVDTNAYTAADVPAMLAGTYRYHTQSLGWCDIAYNFLIDKFGGTWQGRSGDITEPIMSGATKGFNTSSVSVSYIGQYQPGATPAVAYPSQASLDAGRNLIAWKFDMHQIDPDATVTAESAGSTKYAAGTWVTLPSIAGHRDVGLTACPGDYLYDRLPAMRTGVSSILAAAHRWSPFPTSYSLVTQQYRDILKRSGTSTEISSATTQLESGQLSPGQFVTDMLTSAEADTKTNSVIRLYFAFFLRPPDHAGITYWIGQHDAGLSIARIADSFEASAEFRQRYGTLSNTQYITQVYLNVLGRLPDSTGLTYWQAQMTKGVSRGVVMARFSESAEYIAKSKLQVVVSAAFEDLVQRAVDMPAFLYFTDQLMVGGVTLPDFIRGLFTSPEYQQRF